MKGAQSTPLSDVLKMRFEERADLAEFYRKAYLKRLADAKKADPDNLPYGVYRMEQDLREKLPYWNLNLETPVFRINGGQHVLNPEWDRPYINNTLAAFISGFQDFFSWKSSTVKGYQNILKREEQRWFGYHFEKDPVTGRRKKVLNYQYRGKERTKFWNLFHELQAREGNQIINSDSIAETGYGVLWNQLVKRDDFDIENADMVELIRIMEASLAAKQLVFPEHAEEDMESGGNGRDPIFVGDAFGENDAFAD